MERLTDRKTAATLKDNADGLRAVGLEPTISDLMYIKLAEYENVEELIKTATHAPVLSYQTAAIKAVLEGKGVKCKAHFASNTTKTIFDELASYAIDEDPQEKRKLYFCNAKERHENRKWKGRVIK